MKVLVAAEGTSSESLVARRFDNAVWYLILDTNSGKREVYQNIAPRDHCKILLTASRSRVSTVLSGGVSPPTARLMLSLNFRLAVATKMPVYRAIDLLKQGVLATADLSDCSQHKVRRVLAQRGARLAGASPLSVPGKFTPRGRHPLQQYGGRGH